MIRLIKSIYAILVNLNNRFRIVLLNWRDGISVDKSCQVYKGAQVRIWKGGAIIIGPKAEIMTGALIFTYGGNITIGENCSINPYCVLYGHGGLSIGNNVLIAGGTMIIPSNHTFADRSVPIALQGNEARGIVIEDDVWIGHACSILDGVTIGKGSVIAAGSVVKDNVEPYSVMGGVPARLIRKRE